MFLWGINVIAVKILVEHFSPIFIQSLRVMFAGLTLFVIIYFFGELKKITGKEWITVLMISFWGVFVHHLCLAEGLTMTTASNTAIILALVPVTTSILAIIFLGEQFTLLRVTGIISGFIGVALVITNGNGTLAYVSLGDLLIVGAMVSQAISLIFIKKITQTADVKQVTALTLMIGAASLFALSLMIRPQGFIETDNITFGLFFIFLFSSLIATGAGHVLYNLSMKKLGAGPASMYNNLIPIFALLGAVIFLNEIISIIQIFGLLFILVGILLGTGYLDTKLSSGKLKHQAGCSK